MRYVRALILLIFLFWSLSGICFAQSQYSATLTRMEKSLFGMDYASQTDDARLKRIEESVYGSASNNSVPSRVSRLSKDLSADLMGKEIKPKTDTFAEDSDSIKEDPIPKADKTVNYPVVDNLEKVVFNKEFKTVDIGQRLANLEKNVFKKVYNDDLNARVDRLKQAVAPQKVARNSEDDEDSDSDETYYYGPKSSIDLNKPAKTSMMDQSSQFQDYNYGNNASGDDTDDYDAGQGASGFASGMMPRTIPSYNRNNSVLDEYPAGDDMNLTASLSNLERRVLKRTYPHDTNANRLLRMELKLFNTAFTDDDEQARFNRIASAYQAKKTSSRYDNNKFSQHAATAMQVGAILLMILAAIL